MMKKAKLDLTSHHSGAWLIVPSYMIYQLGSELVDAVTIASGTAGSPKEE